MDYARDLIIESADKIIHVTLRNPLTLPEIWQHFVRRNRHPAIATLSGGVARVTFYKTL